MREQDEQRSAGEEIEIGAADAAPLEAEPLGTCSQCGAGIAAGTSRVLAGLAGIGGVCRAGWWQACVNL